MSNSRETQSQMPDRKTFKEDSPSSHLDERLDEALDESFPASDPIAVHQIDTKPPAPKPTE